MYRFIINKRKSNVYRDVSNYKGSSQTEPVGNPSIDVLQLSLGNANRPFSGEDCNRHMGTYTDILFSVSGDSHKVAGCALLGCIAA